MASLCKSQQCSIERRGFRQELDSWRYKLIHCVGFESILEGLFGPGLLKDLHLFKDCEPTGVCDWSFDENCLFCCLRREKVKEHLAGLHKPVSESGQENILKQEQAKIIRLERQAEEFLNAVFYKKDSPRVSDPNIPLVAREIMQRMIRQFAAEYTSKNSSTQDSSQPNSTKNQSLQKSSSGQSSPPPATTQNPVLSKLLMADQDSPLDLTVKKSQSEEDCEQEDGVLDLSTKKSPSSGSTFVSVSPSTSNSIGNGMQSAVKNTRDLNNSTNRTLEKFMVKLCTHHRKQFTHVLKHLCNEESTSGTERTSTSISSSLSNFPNTDAENVCACPEYKSNTSVEQEGKCDYPHQGTKTSVPAGSAQCPVTDDESDDLPINVSAMSEDCSFLSTNQVEEIVENKPLAYNISSEEKFHCEKNVTRCPKKHDRIYKSDSENCTVYQKSLGRVLSSDNQDPAFGINLPKIAGKENSLQTSPIAATFNVNESDCKLKLENTFHNVVTNKLGNHLNHCEKSSYEYFQDFRGSSVCKSRFHANMKQSKSRKCKRAPGFRINEYDNQCDVVYVSQPITECQFETQNAVLYSRNTARKSTRRYFLSDECCELSTVRTLVRSSSEEERGSCACLEITNASGIHTAMVSETQSSQEVESLLFLKETGIGENPLKLLPQSEKITATSLNENGIEPVKNQVIQNVPMEHASGPLIALLSLVHKEKNEHDDRSHIEKSLSSQENEESLNTVTAEYTQIKCIGDCASFTANEKSIPNLETNLSNDFTSSVHLGQEESILAVMGTDHKDSLENKNIPSKGDMVLEQYNQCSAKLTVGESLVPLENSCTNTSVETTSVSSVFSMPEIEPLISCSNENASGENVQEMEMSQSVCKTSKEEISNENTEVSNSAIKTTLPLENSLSIDFQKATKIEDVYDLIDNCTKTNVSSSELEHEYMQERTSPKCNSAVFEKENSKSVQSFKDGIGNPALLTPQKREKFLATSDRRLRSREMQETGKGHVDNAPVVWKDNNLQIKLCELPGTKNIQRLVYIRSKTNACFATDKTLSYISPNNSICEQSLSNMLTEEHVSKIMFANQYSSSFSLLENMEISVDLSSNKRRIYFPAEKKDCLLNIESVSGKNTHNETVCNSVLKNQKKASSKCSSISFSSTRSKMKSLIARTPTKPKRSALPKYNLRPSFTENDTEQPIKCDKRSEQIFHQSGVFANSIELSNTDSDRSKFVHWYSEEENQERISNFNNKYMSVHQSWIPLEKETHLAQKTKNKSDKLKEIWKTKKRVRKNRSAREAQKCSPVQMLFMNSYKISDICRWFLETTETKSLVIVKKLNTRLPEDLPLPMMPLHRYSPSELYPYTLQAERLKKHLKKFASVLPVRNNQNTQIPLTKLIEKEEPEPCDDSVCEASRTEMQETNDCKLPPVNIKKPTRVRILQKYNSIRGKLRHQTVSVKTGKKEHAINTVASRPSRKGTSNKPVIVPKKSLHLLADSPILKSLGTKESNKRGKKRSKEDSTAKSTRQPRKKRKIEIKPAVLKKHLKSISPASKKVKNVKKMGRLNKSKLPKKERVKNKTCKSKRLASKRKTKAILSRSKSKRINRSIKKTKQTTLTKPKTISEKVAKHRFTRRSTPRPQKTDTVKTVSKSTTKKCVLSHQPKRNKRSKSNSPAPVKRRSLEVK